METIKMKNDKKAIIGLNRTMQYGNPCTWRYGKAKNQGLNRTMQYGNYMLEGGKTPIFESLNRTMQYGNTRAGECFACGCEV